MKKSLITSLLLLASFFTFGQDMSKLFNTQEFVWCGLDFSMVRCIGPEGFTDPQAVKEKHFDDWNNLVITEASKYNFKEAYQKTTQANDLSVVKRRNELPDYKTFIISNSYSFEEGQLKKIIADYKLESNKEGLGLVYVYETLNKTEGHAVVNVVFFDIASKEIIWTKKYQAAAGGFGFRNFWARSAFVAMEESKGDYKKALKTYEKSLKKK
jgi:hypothetical protein